MTTGLTTDLMDLSDTRNSAVINNELLRLDVDIAALQETHFAEIGSLREKDCTFYWCGKAADETREHGISFTIKNSLLGLIEPSKEGDERILSLCLHTSDGPAPSSVSIPPLSTPHLRQKTSSMTSCSQPSRRCRQHANHAVSGHGGVAHQGP